jgi:probable phosphoglycerate mutase
MGGRRGLAPRVPAGGGRKGVKIVLVRHGETEWSRAGRHTGRTDVELTATGRRQAAAIGRRLAGRPWAVVRSSPLRRARDTCRLAGLGDRVVIDEDLREWDYGDYEGLTTPEVLERDPSWSLWQDGCRGGEAPADVGRRADRVIERLRAAGGDAVVFAHGHLLRVVGARWVGEPPAFGARLMLSTGSLSVLGWEHGVEAISAWDETSHHAAAWPEV